MKFSAVAVLAAATGAIAYPGNVTVITEVVESYVTYCPSPTTISHGSSTWTVTEPTTITITDCPCTITKPIITTSSVVCNTCTSTGHMNSTMTEHVPIPTNPVPTNPGPIPTGPAPTGGITITTEPVLPTGTPEPVPTGGAAKFGVSGLFGLAVVAALL